MSQLRMSLAAVALMGFAALASAQDDLLAQSQIVRAGDAAAAAPPVPPARMPLMPMTLELDERGFPPPGPPYSLFSPFEVYVRGGPSFSIGDGILDRVLRTGKSITGGARSFLFNDDNSAAWTSDLALEYIYNDSQSSSVVLQRVGVAAVTRFGQTINLPMETDYSLRELHRTSMRIALGREWYFGGEDWGGIRLNFGVDTGGKLGHVSAKLGIERRDIQGLQPIDNVPNFDDGHTSSVNKGVFVGVNTGLLFPMDGYDVTFGARFEWGQDWFRRIANNDTGLEQIQTLLFVGVRY